MSNKSDINWNYCSKVWDGKPCVNKARYRNGSQCCTCANRNAEIKNPGITKQYGDNYYKKNKEKRRAVQQRYYYRNQDSEKSRAWLYRYNNPEKVKEYNDKVHTPRKRAQRAAERALLAQKPSHTTPGTGVEPAGQPKD